MAYDDDEKKFDDEKDIPDDVLGELHDEDDEDEDELNDLGDGEEGEKWE